MLLFRKTIPSPLEVKTRYQSSDRANSYIRFRSNDNANYRYLQCYFDMVADLMVRRQPRRILDVGCGSGPLIQRLRRRLPEAGIVGLDISRPLLQAVEHAETVQGDAARLPFADHSFDVVGCVAVSELFTDSHFAAILRELRRVTAEGGCLVVQYRNPTSLWEPYWWLYRYPYYQNAYSRRKLERLALATDLPISHFQGTYLAAPPLIYRNHRAIYRNMMPAALLSVMQRVDTGYLARWLRRLCRHFIVVHEVTHAAEGARRFGAG